MKNGLMFGRYAVPLVVLGLMLAGCGEHSNKVLGLNGAVDEPATAQVPKGDAALPLYATQADRDWWRALTQAQRDQAVVSRANADNTKYVGLNCKEWARRVVLDASRGTVNLPSTLPNASGWYFSASPYLVNVGSIRDARTGNVVQVNWRLSSGAITPHTMIVTSNTADGINVIESNWSASLTVSRRFISYATFGSKVTAYTVYRVIGG